MANDLRKLDYIDALRGYAILAVVMLHSSQALPPAAHALEWVMARGELGVQLFYLASALTLSMSWHARNARELTPVRNFFLRRFFRIAPMFYLTIVGFLLFHGLAPTHWAPNGIPWFAVPLTAMFLHGFHPETANSVITGGWSIAVEMTFYACLPALVGRLTTMPRCIAFLIFSIVVSYAGRAAWLYVYSGQYPADEQYLVRGSAYYAFHTHLPVFAFGIIAYRVIVDSQLTERVIRWGGAAFVCIAVIAAFLLPPAVVGRLTSHYLVMSGVLTLGIVVLSRYPLRAICNPVALFFGKVSFSMYLLHMAILDLLLRSNLRTYFGSNNWGTLVLFVAVSAMAGLAFYPCYRLIELPGIQMGKRVIAALDRRATGLLKTPPIAPTGAHR